MPEPLTFDTDEGFCDVAWSGPFLRITTSVDGFSFSFEQERKLLDYLAAGPYAD